MYQGYKITKCGKVISYKRKTPCELKQATKKKGYKFVTLSIKGQKVYKMVHQLVAEAYVPNPDNKPFVNHKDGNPANNHYSNLEWSTNKENIQHAFSIGLCDEFTSKSAKLDWEKVEYIRSSSLPNTVLAKQFNVKPNTISDVKNFITWKKK